MNFSIRGHAIAQWQDGRSATLIAEGPRSRWVGTDSRLTQVLNLLLGRYRERSRNVRELTSRCLDDPASPPGAQLISLHQESQRNEPRPGADEGRTGR